MVQQPTSKLIPIECIESHLQNNDPDRLRSIPASLQHSRWNAAIVGELKRRFEGKKAIEPWRGNVSYIKIVKSLNISFLLFV